MSSSDPRHSPGAKPIHPRWHGVRVMPNGGLSGLKKAVATGKTVHVSRELWAVLEPYVMLKDFASVVERLDRIEILMLPELSPGGYKDRLQIARAPL